VPIAFYGTYLSQHLLFVHGFFGAVFAPREKDRRLAVSLPNPDDAMGDETSLGAIKSDVSDFDL
jgi:hypothetical protein